MLWLILMALGAVSTPAPVAAAPRSKPQLRCGWIDNPTPQNFWLQDRDGEWVISEQGGYEAEAPDDLDLTSGGTVRYNGMHGKSCACLTVTVDRATERVVRIYKAKPLPVRQCRADKRLSRWRP